MSARARVRPGTPTGLGPDAERPWIRRYDAGVPPRLTYPALPLDGLLRVSARRFPHLPALRCGSATLAWGQLDQTVDDVAAGLATLDVEPGDRVCLFMPNCPELVVAYFGAWRAGAVVVPASAQSTSAELQRLVEHSSAKVLVVAATYEPRVADLIDSGVARHVVWAGGDAAESRSPRSAGSLRRQRTRGDGRWSGVSFAGLPHHGPAGRVASRASSSDPAALLCTGGTTGAPKVALLTHRNLVANACQIAAWAPNLAPGREVMLAALPLAHAYAITTCMNLSILRGWTQVLIPNPRDLDGILTDIARFRVSVLPGVPTLYASVARHPSVVDGRLDLGSVELCLSGAAALPAETQTAFERATGARLVEGYGLTEASPVTHVNPLATLLPGGGIGLPLPDTDARIVDAETETTAVEPGCPGILCVAGPQVMAGYWRRPEETHEVLRVDGDGRTWLHTGDVAEMGDDGSFRVLDRKKDVILAAGGLKVYPSEIENILLENPKVGQAAVIGVPVSGTDQRAKAFVVLAPGEERASGDEILGFLRERVAPYKVPRSIEFRTELPIAFTGKVLRRMLADEERRRFG